MKNKKLLITFCTILGTLILLFAAFFIYVGSYYHADGNAISAFNYDGFETQELDGESIAFVPNIDYKTGIIFYPGGKVEHTSYIPLMKSLASRGILTVLVKMPFNLAVFDIDAADGIQNSFENVEHWYMAGHSLGGSMACEYALDNADAFDGIILLASYSAADLSKTDLRVLSIYGSEDKVLDKEKYESSKVNLPSDFTEHIINGGNHAQFGSYGEQKGDGVSIISDKKQIEEATNTIVEYLKQA